MPITLVVEPYAVPPRPSQQRRLVADVLRELRNQAGISQEDLAPRVGLTLAGYRPYEQGKRDLSGEQIPVFAEALQVSRAELAARLGLGAPEIRSVYAAEVTELLSKVDDDAAREDLMNAIRAMARIAGRQERA